MILGIDKNRVVGTRRYTGFAPDADRFVEVYNAISSLEHRCGGTSGDTRGMCALITAGNLMGSTCLREDADVDVLYIGSSDG